MFGVGRGPVFEVGGGPVFGVGDGEIMLPGVGDRERILLGVGDGERILLGVGDDGHTASLFPETDALDHKVRKVVANFIPKFNAWRITFTYPLINQARHVCFLANANKNRSLLEQVVQGDQQYPAARVAPSNGELTWILAEA